MIQIDLIVKYLPFLLQGALLTIYIATITCLIGLTGGTLLALAQTRGGSLLKYLVTFFVTIIRGTPMLIQIAFFYYAIMPALHVQFSPLTAAIIAIGANSCAYISQVVRSGILSVHKGQLEAAQVLGLSQVQTIRYIILPQALAAILPSLGNEFITLIKDSSLASSIGVVELYKQGLTMRSVTFDAMSTFTIVALIYLTMTTALSWGMHYLERKVHTHAKN